MKVGVLSRHWGMTDYFKGVLKDHEVKIYDMGHDKIQNDCDVYVVGLPVLDLKHVLPLNKPVISYPALWDWNPDYNESGYPQLKEAIERGKFTMVINDNCWTPSLHKLFPELQVEYIPYAFDNVPKWTGREAKVVVAIRDVNRLKSYTDQSLQQVLEGIPYELHTYTDRPKLLQRFADCRAMFYFSNSPWTLVFCEAMSVGTPLVTFNEHPTGDYANVAGDVKTINAALKRLLASQELARQYSERNLRLANRIMNFEQTKDDWNKLLSRV